MAEKIGLVGQTILALIPSYVLQVIAFYRIRRLKKGGLLILGLFGVTVLFDYFFIIPLELQQFSLIPQIIIIIPPSVHFVRKWTREYNAKVGTPFD